MIKLVFQSVEIEVFKASQQRITSEEEVAAAHPKKKDVLAIADI